MECVCVRVAACGAGAAGEYALGHALDFGAYAGDFLSLRGEVCDVPPHFWKTAQHLGKVVSR